MSKLTTSRRGALKFLGLAGITTAIAPAVLMQACQEAAQQGVAYGYQSLSPAQAATVKAIQDAIIPRTDTPSASEVGSVEFLDTYITHGWQAADRDRLLYRLDKFATQLNTDHSITPTDATEAQMAGMLDNFLVNFTAAKSDAATDMEIEGNSVERKQDATETHEQAMEAIVYDEDPVELNDLLTGLRGLTLESYFQSEEIGLNVMNYLPVPGEYVGQYPMSKMANGRDWSLG